MLTEEEFKAQLCENNSNLSFSDIENSKEILKEKDLKVEGYLGVGSYGAVILTCHTFSINHFAVKIIKLENPNERTAVRSETDVMRAFRNKYLLELKLVFFSNDYNIIYLVLQFCPNGNLETFMKNNIIS